MTRITKSVSLMATRYGSLFLVMPSKSEVSDSKSEKSAGSEFCRLNFRLALTHKDL